MKKYLTRKNLLSFALFALLAIPAAWASTAHGIVSLGLETAAGTGLGTRDLKETIVQVLNVILGFLGIIAVIIILLGGFKWMTAMGGDDKIAEAKKLISAGIVGLVVILAAYAIAFYVVNTISTATTVEGGER